MRDTHQHQQPNELINCIVYGFILFIKTIAIIAAIITLMAYIAR